MMKTIIKDGLVVTPQGISEGAVLLDDGNDGHSRITAVGNVNASADEVIDAEGAYVCPGFIDMHTHGAGGADYMDGTVDAYLTASRMQAVHGATLVYPTTQTSSNEVLFESFETYRKAVGLNVEGARFGGLSGHHTAQAWECNSLR